MYIYIYMRVHTCICIYIYNVCMYKIVYVCMYMCCVRLLLHIVVAYSPEDP